MPIAIYLTLSRNTTGFCCNILMLFAKGQEHPDYNFRHVRCPLSLTFCNIFYHLLLLFLLFFTKFYYQGLPPSFTTNWVLLLQIKFYHKGLPPSFTSLMFYLQLVVVKRSFTCLFYFTFQDISSKKIQKNVSPDW